MAMASDALQLCADNIEYVRVYERHVKVMTRHLQALLASKQDAREFGIALSVMERIDYEKQFVVCTRPPGV